MRGELHYSEDVEKVMTDMITTFRSKVMGVGSKLAPMIVSRTELNTVEDIVERELATVLEELSEYNPEDFYNDEYVDVEDEIETENIKEVNEDV